MESRARALPRRGRAPRSAGHERAPAVRRGGRGPLMPSTYVYRVRDKGGRLLEGSLEADNTVLVASKLREMGYYPISIEARSTGGLQTEIHIPGMGTRGQAAGDGGVRPPVRHHDQRRPDHAAGAEHPGRADGQPGAGRRPSTTSEPTSRRARRCRRRSRGTPRSSTGCSCRWSGPARPPACSTRCCCSWPSRWNARPSCDRRSGRRRPTPSRSCSWCRGSPPPCSSSSCPCSRACTSRSGGKLPAPTLMLISISHVFTSYFPLVVAGDRGIGVRPGDGSCGRRGGGWPWDTIQVARADLRTASCTGRLSAGSPIRCRCCSARACRSSRASRSPPTRSTTPCSPTAIKDAQNGVQGGDTVSRPLANHPIVPGDGDADDVRRRGDRRTGRDAREGRRLLRPGGREPRRRPDLA